MASKAWWNLLVSVHGITCNVLVGLVGFGIVKRE